VRALNCALAALNALIAETNSELNGDVPKFTFEYRMMFCRIPSSIAAV
jgi:hypothetical protein